jgi:glutamine transport system permease protein
MIDAIMDSAYIKSMPFLWEGLKITVTISALGLLLGTIIGAIVGLGKLSKSQLIRKLCTVYIEIIRGTPILAQAIFIYFGLAELNLDKFSTGVIVIAINAGAYIAEIVRGAVYSIDKGQGEAGRSLGLTEKQTMRYIIWPQAFKRMIPPLGNQFVISLKDTSILSVIAVPELLYKGRQYYNATVDVFETLVMVCVLYLCITIPLAIILRKLERKLDV